MKKNYYLFNPGRMSRRDQTLKFVPVDALGNADKPRYLPVEGVDDLYVFGSLDTNSALYNFLGRQSVAAHFFDYYGHYTGSFMPREYLLAGKVQIEQTRAYLDKRKRLHVAKGLLEAAVHNMYRNLRYYANKDKDLSAEMGEIASLRAKIPIATEVAELMGLEGNCRKAYYKAFDLIINDFEMGGRSKQPPKNEVNALVSFGNMMCYTAVLGQIRHTQLNPTISFLHEPGTRRYSLSLDLAEVFKPVLVDRLIFRMLNKRVIKASDFDNDVAGIRLKDGAKKAFVRGFDELLQQTIKHRALNRQASYRRLIRLECHKLSKYILGMSDSYTGLKMDW